MEHWVVAERQGQVAAANMLGRDEPFTMVPFFWTKHFDLSIRYVGHAEKWEETHIEGDLAHRDCLVRFRRDGRDLAVATVERDKNFSALSWRWKASPSGPREQAQRLRTLVGIPRSACWTARRPVRCGYRRPNGPPRCQMAIRNGVGTRPVRHSYECGDR